MKKYVNTATEVVLFILVTVFITSCTKNDETNSETSATSSEEQPHIVFLVNEDPFNYQSYNTIPLFADMLGRDYGFTSTVIEGEGELPGIHFPGLDVLAEADLLVVFFRRAALPEDQLQLIKDFLNDGNPLIGIKSANHAFSVRDEDRGNIPDGHEDWWDFVPDILGSLNRGYGPSELNTDVSVVQGMESHPILENFEPAQWQSEGNIYHVSPLLDENATVLLTGKSEDDTEPIAWTRMAGESRVFYTSLGHPDDFEVPQFRNLLINAIHWALELDE